MAITTLGIDLAKNVFQLHGVGVARDKTTLPMGVSTTIAQNEKNTPYD